MTISRAGLISGGTLLVSLIVIQVIRISQDASQDPSGAFGQSALVTIAVGGAFAVLIFVNRDRFSGSRVTPSWVRDNLQDREWISVIQIDRASLQILKAARWDVTSFGLLKSPDGIELWDLKDPTGPVHVLAQKEIESLEITEPSWFSESGGQLILGTQTGADLIPLDAVGTLWGTLPPSRKRLLRIREGVLRPGLSEPRHH